MFRTATDVAAGLAARRADVRRMLVERRRELLLEIQSRIRDAREEGSRTDHHAPHPGEPLEAEPDEDLAFALIELKAEMLQRVNEAVRSFDEGGYGSCLDCGAVIGSARLQAMPFAVRCRHCQERREGAQPRHRVQLPQGLSALGARM